MQQFKRLVLLTFVILCFRGDSQAQTNDPLIGQQRYLFDVHRIDEAWNYSQGSSTGRTAVFTLLGAALQHEDLSAARIQTPANQFAAPRSGYGTEALGIIAATTNNNKGIAGIDRSGSFEVYTALRPQQYGDDPNRVVTWVGENGITQTATLDLGRFNTLIMQARGNSADVHLFTFGIPSGFASDYLEINPYQTPQPSGGTPAPPKPPTILYPQPKPSSEEDIIKKNFIDNLKNLGGRIYGGLCGGFLEDCSTAPDPLKLLRIEMIEAVIEDKAVIVTPAGDLEPGQTAVVPPFMPSTLDRYAVTIGGLDYDPGDQTITPWERSNPSPFVDVAAVATDITTVSPVGTNQYISNFGGTAAAASIGAGVSSLIKAVRPEFTGEDVEEVLKRSARDTGVIGVDDKTGYGAIDAENALRFASQYAYEHHSAQITIPIASSTIVSPNTNVTLEGYPIPDHCIYLSGSNIAKGDLKRFNVRVEYSQPYDNSPHVWLKWSNSSGVNTLALPVQGSNVLTNVRDGFHKGLRIISSDNSGFVVEGHFWDVRYYTYLGQQTNCQTTFPIDASITDGFRIDYTIVHAPNDGSGTVPVVGATYNSNATIAGGHIGNTTVTSGANLTVNTGTNAYFAGSLDMSAGGVMYVRGRLTLKEGVLFRGREIRVYSGGELIVEEGAQVQFTGGAGIWSEGRVTMRGTAQDPISISGLNGAQYSYIYLYGSGAHGSLFNHVNIQNSTYGIHTNYANIELDNVTGSNNYGQAIKLYGGTSTVDNSDFYNNTGVGAFLMTGVFYIDDSRFYGNGHTGLSVGYSGHVAVGLWGDGGIDNTYMTMNGFGGVNAYSDSYVVLGDWISPGDFYGGGAKIAGNGQRSISASTNSTVYADLLYWGSYTGPDWSRINAETGAQIEIECWLEGPLFSEATSTCGSSSLSSMDASAVIQDDQEREAHSRPSQKRARLARKHVFWGDLWKQMDDDPAGTASILEVTISDSADADSRYALLMLQALEFEHNPREAASKTASLIWPLFGADKGDDIEARGSVRKTALALDTGVRGALAKRLFYAATVELDDRALAERSLALLTQQQDVDVENGLLPMLFEQHFGSAAPHNQKMLSPLEVEAAELTISAYPNPARNHATLRYTLPDDMHVTLEVFDVLGRKVSILVNENQSLGTHDVVFATEGLSSGLYMYRLSTRAGTLSGQITIFQ